jgi:hypothetical protein
MGWDGIGPKLCTARMQVGAERIVDREKDAVRADDLQE